MSQHGDKKLASKVETFKRRNRTSAAVSQGSDLKEVLDFRTKIKEALSISDVAESNAIPYFTFRPVGGDRYGGELEDRSVYTAGTGVTTKTDKSGLESLSIRGSTILNEYGKYEPTGHKAFVMEKKHNLDDPDQLQELFMRASRLVVEARKSLDPSKAFFEAAATYEEMANMPKSILYYERAVANQCDPGRIVDEVIMPWTPMLQRKVEHLNRDQVKKFWELRNKERDERCFEEAERQRLRILVAHCQLVRLHMLADDPKNAHLNLTSSFHKCTSAIEHLEVLHYMNSILKECSDIITPEVSRAMQIYKGTAGPLPEAHIEILKELLEEDGRDIDTLQWLARRYAEKSEFEVSKSYYRRIRDLKDSNYDAKDTLDRYQMRDVGANLAQSDWEAAIWKRPSVGSFSFNTEKDERMQRIRTDYTSFPGLHQAAQTTFYVAPLQGWEAAQEYQHTAVMSKMKEAQDKIATKKQRARVLPVINGKVIHPDSIMAKRMQLEKEAQARRTELLETAKKMSTATANKS